MSAEPTGQHGPPRSSRSAVAKPKKAGTAKTRGSRSIPAPSSAAQLAEELEPLRDAAADVEAAMSPATAMRAPRSSESARRSLVPSAGTARSSSTSACGACSGLGTKALVGYRKVRGKRHPAREAARGRAAPTAEAAASETSAGNVVETAAAPGSMAAVVSAPLAEAALSEASGDKAPQKASSPNPVPVCEPHKARGKSFAKKKIARSRPQIAARARAVTGGKAAEVAVGLSEEKEGCGESTERSGLGAWNRGRVSALERFAANSAGPLDAEKPTTDILADQVTEAADRENDISCREELEEKRTLHDEEGKEAAGLAVHFQTAPVHKLKVKGDSDPGVQKESEKRCSVSSTGSTDFVFSFRFFNYNMGNKPEVQIDNIGAGFASRRCARRSVQTEADRAEQRASLAMDIGDVDLQSLSQSLGSGSTTGLWCGRRVPLEELLAAGVPGKDEATFRPSFRQSNLSGEPVLALVPQEVAPPTASTALGTMNRARGFMNRASAIFRSRSSPALASRKAKTTVETKSSATQQKQKQLKDWLQPADRSSAVCSVDCAFGVLCETKFNLSHLDGVAEDTGEGAAVKRIHAHNMSAVQTMAERGGLNGMKGMVAGTIVGDLRTVVLCSSTLEEVENGKVFCPFDEVNVMEKSKLKSNPMKCFMGQTFDAACGALRFVFLGTHFPMQKIAKIMADSTQDSNTVLPQLKGVMARTLRKILRHALLDGVLDSRTMLILQGDLNSRTVHVNGRWFDLLHETLRDPMLQNFIAAELPMELQGEWLEVGSPCDPGQLPVTYRFDSGSKRTVTEGCPLRLHQVYGNMGKELDGADNASSTASTRLPSNLPSADSSIAASTPTTAAGTPLTWNNTNSTFPLSPLADAAQPYREIMDKLGPKVDEWGIFQQKGDIKEEKGKSRFKPGRLPSCTERVIYYAPAGLQQRTQWHSQQGYEVNYQQLGSDHKPVLMEATLRVGRCAPGTSPKRSRKVLNRWSLNSQDSDCSSPLLSRASSADDLDSEDSRSSNGQRETPSDRPQSAPPVKKGAGRPSDRHQSAPPVKKGEGMFRRRARTAVRIVTQHGHFHDLL